MDNIHKASSLKAVFRDKQGKQQFLKFANSQGLELKHGHTGLRVVIGPKEDDMSFCDHFHPKKIGPWGRFGYAFSPELIEMLIDYKIQMIRSEIVMCMGILIE